MMMAHYEDEENVHAVAGDDAHADVDYDDGKNADYDFGRPLRTPTRSNLATALHLALTSPAASVRGAARGTPLSCTR